MPTAYIFCIWLPLSVNSTGLLTFEKTRDQLIHNVLQSFVRPEGKRHCYRGIHSLHKHRSVIQKRHLQHLCS